MSNFQTYIKYNGKYGTPYTDPWQNTGSWSTNDIKAVSDSVGRYLVGTLGWTVTNDAPETGSTNLPVSINAAATGASPTLTGALVVGGIITHSGQTGAVTLTCDTAANILAKFPLDMQANWSKIAQKIRIINNNTASGVITLTADAGPTVTISGTATVAVSGVWRDFLLTFQSATACTFTNIGSGTA